MSDSQREIERLLFLYAERIDLGDFDGVADLFAQAVLKGPVGDTGVRGRDAVLAL